MPNPSPIRFEGLDTPAAALHAAVTPATRQHADIGWRHALPILGGAHARLRELAPADAPSLLTMLTTEEVTRFISPPPTTVREFERFIEWTHRERAAGTQVVYGILPAGYDVAMGLIQLRQMSPRFLVAEWGFALGSPFWGSGVFMDSARLVLDLAFTEIGIHRLEARSAVQNGRGNGVLRKLGAVQEGLLRQSLPRRGTFLDQVLWSILAEDWLQAKAVWSATIH